MTDSVSRPAEPERVYRVVDVALHVHVLDSYPPTVEDLERFLDDEHRDGWDMVAAVDGVFSAVSNPNIPGRRTPPPSPRTLLVLRRSRSRTREERLPAPTPRTTTVAAEVVRRAAEAFLVQSADVLTRPFKRTRQVTRARHVAAYALRATGLSYPEVGTAMAHMDHTSIMSACRKVERTPELLAVAMTLIGDV